MASYARSLLAKLKIVAEDDDDALRQLRNLQRPPSRTRTESASTSSDSQSRCSESEPGPSPSHTGSKPPPAGGCGAAARAARLLRKAGSVANEGLSSESDGHSSQLESPDTTPNESVERASASGAPGSGNGDGGDPYEKHVGVVGVVRLLDPVMGGTIDNKYWFHPSDFRDAKMKFKLGDKVEFTAEQTRADTKFRVTEMKHYISPLESQLYENSNHSTESGYIDQFEPNGGAIVPCKDGMKIKVDLDKLPKKCQLGDWLKLKLKFGDMNQASGSVDYEVLSAEPTMTKKIQGALLLRVDYRENGRINTNVKSHIRSGVIWLIDGQIIADEKLVRNAGAKHDCFVIVEAVESNQGAYKYRAVYLEIIRNKDLIRKLRQNQTKPKECVLSSEQEQYLRALYNNKEGVIIEPKRHLNFGKVALNSAKEKTISIQNTKTTPLILKEIKLGGDQSVAKFEPIHLNREADDIITIIPQGETWLIKMKATASMCGQTSEIIIFEFNDCKVARDLQMFGYSPDDEADERKRADQEKQNGEYGGRTRNESATGSNNRRSGAIERHNEYADKRKQLRERESARGASAVRPAFFGQKNFRLDNYDIPPLVAEAHKSQLSDLLFEEFPSLRFTQEFLDSKPKMIQLSPENYSDCFQAGLWLEEIEDGVRLNELSLKDVKLFREANDVMYFRAPNYEPSQIQMGMSFVVYDEADPTGKRFESSITKIESTGYIYGHFHRDLITEYRDQPMCVNYRVSRTTYRRWHFAATHAMETLGKEWLFPEKLQVQPPRVTLIEDDGEGSTDEENNSEHSAANEASESESESENTSTASTASSAPESPPKDSGRNQVRMRADRFKSLQKTREELNMRKASVYPASLTRKHVPEVLDKYVKLIWFNKALNSEQKEAVRRILKGQCRPHPFVIHGPPGTGKTVTLVEAVLQVKKFFKNARILITAPTNAAADLITEYLVDSQSIGGDMTRLMGFSRSPSTVPDKIKRFCTHPEGVANAAKSSILITTTNSVALLFEADIAHDNFSHVFIDEAGCCFEPDGLLPALFVNVRAHGQLIMAGDHKQLGPHVHSTNAKFYGLEISFLQRIMETKLYSAASSDSVFVTKLVKNYRSHEAILKVPSLLFYNDELVAQTKPDETLHLLAELKKWGFPLAILPNPDVPLWFCGIRAEEAREENSYSWFNTSEVQRIVDIVRLLISCRCTPSDIGIITPYRKQADKIRIAIARTLDCDFCDLPKIGTVEVFQGDERKIIILSLVRSIDSDRATPYMMSKLSFVFSETRTNVMLTRARCLQIVVGNPHLFCGSVIWLRYIQHCVDLGAYEGCELPQSLNPKLQHLLDGEKSMENQPLAPQPPLLLNNIPNPYEQSIFDEW